MKKDIKNKRKKIIYRCSYSGTKDTDLLYKKFFLEKLDNFTYSDLNQILDLFQNLSDPEIFNILIIKIKPPKKFRKIFNKLINV